MLVQKINNELFPEPVVNQFSKATMIHKIIRTINVLALIFIWSSKMAYADNSNKYINKTVLITITISANHDQVIKKQEIAAKIIRFDEKRIVLLPLGSEDEFGLPPDERFLLKGKKGIYQLENGNVKSITNPDYTTAINLDVNSPGNDKIIKHGFVPA